MPTAEEVLAKWYEAYMTNESNWIPFSIRDMGRSIVAEYLNDIHWGKLHANNKLHPFQCGEECVYGTPK